MIPSPKPKYRCHPKPKHILQLKSTRNALASHNKTKNKLNEPETPPVSFGTDGISFIVDNSATCIICNVRSQFVGTLTTEATTTESANGPVVKQRYIGTYDPKTSFNIIGIPVLERFFPWQSVWTRIPSLIGWSSGGNIHLSIAVQNVTSYLISVAIAW